MKSLGARFRFESAIGMNGRIWLKGRNIQEVIAISNAISLAEHMTNDEIELMCKKLGECIASF